MKNILWTIVQHSGFGYAGKPGFKKGLEIRAINTEAQSDKVFKANGVLFDNYLAADDYCEEEGYPTGVTGMYPRAPGSFSTKKIDGLYIYIPLNQPAGAEAREIK